MSEQIRIAILDVGKTNIKLSVLDENSKEVFSVRKSNDVINTEPYPHFKPEILTEWLCLKLAECCHNHTLTHFSVTTHACAAVLIKEDGTVVLPILDYEYEVINEVNDEYNRIARDFKNTLSPELSGGLNLGRQLFWLQKKFPKEFSETKYILNLPQYCSYFLSGTAATEVTSLGCHSDLWDSITQQYSNLTTTMGWDKLFPPMKKAYDSLGTINPELVSKYKLSQNCEVINGIHDSNASLFRYLKLYDKPFSVVSSGTWTICMAPGSSLENLDENKDTLANTDAYGNPVACSRFMGGREFELIAGPKGPSTKFNENNIKNCIENKYFALPNFAGGSGPFATSKSKITGDIASDADLACLGTLYCALMTDVCLNLIHAKGDLIIEGSLVANEYFPQILAQLRPEQDVLVSNDSSGTLIGTSMLTGKIEANKDALKPLESFNKIPNLIAYRDEWMNQIKP